VEAGKRPGGRGEVGEEEVRSLISLTVSEYLRKEERSSGEADFECERRMGVEERVRLAILVVDDN
jgi:hypothetical protein